MKLERVISIFDKKTELLIEEINVDNINISILKNIFIVNEDDPEMYDPYTITKGQMIMINSYLNPTIDFNDQKFIYQLDCFTVK
jgi:hypothetical protein